jgi:hypothetical protein
MEALCKDGLQGQKQLAQGIALGIQKAQPTPYKGKSIIAEEILLTSSSSVTTRQCLSLLTLPIPELRSPTRSLSLLHRLPLRGVPSLNASTQGDALG